MTTKSKYSALNKTYGINILNFDPLDTGRAFHQLELCDRYLKRPLADLKNVRDMKWSYLNLKSGDFTLIEENRAERLKAWQAFFKAEPLDDDRSEYIEQAYEALDHMYLTVKEQNIMETIDRHYMTVAEYGEEQREEGREEEREKNRQLLINLYLNGKLDFETLQETIDMTEKERKHLLAQLDEDEN